MARKKIKLAWIVNGCARKTSLKKRRLSLLKKVSELNTLCDVSTCVIIYNPDDNEPAVWPSPFLVQQMLARFYDLPDMERQKKMLDYETYLREKVDKLQEKTIKNQRKNNKAEMSYLMHKISGNEGFDELSENELYRLTWFVDEKMEEIGKMYEFLQQISLSLQPGTPHLLLPPPNQGIQNEDLQNKGMHVAYIDSRGVNPSGGEETRIIFKNPPNQLDPWLEILNNNEKYGEGSNSSVGMGLPLLHGGNSRLPSHDMGLLPPHGSFRGYNDIRHLPPYGNVNVGQGNNNAGGIHEIELRPQPYSNINYVGESSRIGGIQDMGFGMQPYGHIGKEGNSSIGGILDMGFDLQPHGNWGEQNNSNIGGIGDMGFRLQPHGNLGGGDNIWSDVGKPFGHFRDGNSGGSI